jgi:hypothetical protein
MEQFYGLIFIGAMIVLYFVVYLANKNTPIPEGCEDAIELSEKCASCKVSSCGAKQRLVKN